MKTDLNLIRHYPSLVILLLLLASLPSLSQNPDLLKVVKPKEIHDVLANPGMGFMTFERTEGEKEDPSGQGYPVMTITYWRKYWRLIEPEMDQYRWDLLDEALEAAREKGQTLLIRIAPYGTRDEDDVPGWYRELVGPSRNWKYQSEVNGWMVDAEDPRYAEHFGGLIRELGAKYDGHPDC
jgi:hypothetical protein